MTPAWTTAQRDAGSVSLNPLTAAVGYLPQEPERRPERACSRSLGGRAGSSALPLDSTRRETLSVFANNNTNLSGASNACAEAFDRWMNLGGADLEERTAKVAASLGLAVRLEAPMTSLSSRPAARAKSGVALVVAV